MNINNGAEVDVEAERKLMLEVVSRLEINGRIHPAEYMDFWLAARRTQAQGEAA